MKRTCCAIMIQRSYQHIQLTTCASYAGMTRSAIPANKSWKYDKMMQVAGTCLGGCLPLCMMGVDRRIGKEISFSNLISFVFFSVLEGIFSSA